MSLSLSFRHRKTPGAGLDFQTIRRMTADTPKNHGPCKKVSLGLSPLPRMPVTTRIRGSRTKPSFPTVTGRGDDPRYLLSNTLPETNSEFTPENGWLEYDSFLLGWPIFRCYVSFRECSVFEIVFYLSSHSIFRQPPSNKNS